MIDIELGKSLTAFDSSRNDARMRGRFEVTAFRDGIVPMHGR